MKRRDRDEVIALWGTLCAKHGVAGDVYLAERARYNHVVPRNPPVVRLNLWGAGNAGANESVARCPPGYIFLLHYPFCLYSFQKE